MGMQRTQSIVTLFGWTVAIYALAAIAGLGSASAPEVYATFNKPNWAPPASLFGPAWGLLYTMIAIAGWLVWRDHRFTGAKIAFTIFAGQLILNVLWSWVFFAWQSGMLAFLNISLLMLMISANILAFWRLKPVAALLLLPYLLWVIFAACLNYSIWQMNPSLL